jgi:PAS domain-containing protein
MLHGHTLAKTIRRWGLVICTGAAGFAAGIAGFTLLGLNGIFRVLNDAPSAVVGTALAVLLTLAALAVGALIAVAQERRRNWAARIALNNMTQGLSMFDGAARLILCNTRYIEMSKLPREDFRKGMPLREILVRRAKAGTFSGDADQYIAGCLKQAAEGRADARTVELKDGRTISLVFRPLASGGWVSTHTDVTQQRVAEKEAIRCVNARNGAPPSTRRSPPFAPAWRACS